jgi:hypothetical protein
MDEYKSAQKRAIIEDFLFPESLTNLSPLRQRGQYMEKSNRKSPHELMIRDENKSTNDRIHQARHAQ